VQYQKAARTTAGLETTAESVAPRCTPTAVTAAIAVRATISPARKDRSQRRGRDNSDGVGLTMRKSGYGLGGIFSPRWTAGRDRPRSSHVGTA
jgi:hypothetical protein